MSQNNDELYHYGVLGMKWGVRRYQNVDGTYTDAGRRKYIKDKTKNITDKSEHRKTAKKAGVKYDKVANKTNKRLADNDRRVKQYGKTSVKFADKAHMAAYTVMGVNITRSIIKNGAAKIRYLRAQPSTTQGKLKTTAALTLIGAGSIAAYTGYVNKKLGQDIIDTNNYDKRQSTKKKKNK